MRNLKPGDMVVIKNLKDLHSFEKNQIDVKVGDIGVILRELKDGFEVKLQTDVNVKVEDLGFVSFDTWGFYAHNLELYLPKGIH